MTSSIDALLPLLGRTLQGDSLAKQRLFIAIRPAIRQGVVCALLFADVRGLRPKRAMDELDDLIHKTVVVLLENDHAVLRRFDPDTRGGNLEAYVCQIAQNTTFGVLRLKKSGRGEIPTAPEDLPDSAENPEDAELAHIRRDLLLRVLEILEPKLTPESRTLFILHFIEGLGGPEICELIGMKPANFWKWASRMRDVCQRIIEKLEQPGSKK